MRLNSPAYGLHGVGALRAIEREAASVLRPGTLMMRAGEAAARWIVGRHPLVRTVRIWCGAGNNGGDGYACALALRARGVAAHCVACDEPSSSDAKQTARRWAETGGVSLPPTRLDKAPPADLVVDALFGIGLARPLAPPWTDWIDAINRSGRPVLALDVPSGLDAERGSWVGGIPGVRAAATLSFLGAKSGLFMADGVDACGLVVIDDLGVALPPASIRLNAPDQFAELCTHRPRDSHKGLFGDLRVVGGASGMCGAALLAARAALHFGAGRVHVDLLDPALGVDPQAPELMLRNQPGRDSPGSISVIGCGLGVDEAGREALSTVLSSKDSCVIDADALNLIASDRALRDRVRLRASGTTVLTPHPLEAARLLDTTGAEVQADRLSAASELAREFNAWIVLKGAGSVICSERQTWVNPTGSSALATAGSGDVLAGMIGGLLAQGFDARCSTLGAVWLHGSAAEDFGQDLGLVASDITPLAATALARLRRH